MKIKNSLYVAALLTATLSACQKKDNGLGLDLNAPASEHVPAGWTTYSSGVTANSSAITLDHSENIWYFRSNSLIKKEDNGLTDYSSSISSYFNSNSIISTLVADNNGDIWAGINNWHADASLTGLLMHDGAGFHAFSPANSGLRDNRVFSIAVDALNNKWIGTASCLVKYDGSSWTVYDTTNSPLKEFYPLVCTGSYIWIGGAHSLKRFDGSTFTSWDNSNSAFPATGISCMEKDVNGNIWFAGNASSVLWKFDGGTFTSFPIPASYQAGYIASIKSDGPDNIWVFGYSFQSLLKFNAASWSSYAVPYVIGGGDPRQGSYDRPLYPTLGGMVIKSDGSKWFTIKYMGFPDHADLLRFKE